MSFFAPSSSGGGFTSAGVSTAGAAPATGAGSGNDSPTRRVFFVSPWAIVTCSDVTSSTVQPAASSPGLAKRGSLRVRDFSSLRSSRIARGVFVAGSRTKPVTWIRFGRDGTGSDLGSDRRSSRRPDDADRLRRGEKTFASRRALRSAAEYVGRSGSCGSTASAGACRAHRAATIQLISLGSRFRGKRRVLDRRHLEVDVQPVFPLVLRRHVQPQ